MQPHQNPYPYRHAQPQPTNNNNNQNTNQHPNNPNLPPFVPNQWFHPAQFNPYVTPYQQYAPPPPYPNNPNVNIPPPGPTILHNLVQPDALAQSLNFKKKKQHSKTGKSEMRLSFYILSELQAFGHRALLDFLKDDNLIQHRKHFKTVRCKQGDTLHQEITSRFTIDNKIFDPIGFQILEIVKYTNGQNYKKCNGDVNKKIKALKNQQSASSNLFSAILLNGTIINTQYASSYGITIQQNNNNNQAPTNSNAASLPSNNNNNSNIHNSRSNNNNNNNINNSQSNHNTNNNNGRVNNNNNNNNANNMTTQRNSNRNNMRRQSNNNTNNNTINNNQTEVMANNNTNNNTDDNINNTNTNNIQTEVTNNTNTNNANTNNTNFNTNNNNNNNNNNDALPEAIRILSQMGVTTIYKIPFNVIKQYIDSTISVIERDCLLTEMNYKLKFKDMLLQQFDQIKHLPPNNTLQTLLSKYNVNNTRDLCQKIDSLDNLPVPELKRMINNAVIRGQMTKKCADCGQLMIKKCTKCEVEKTLAIYEAIADNNITNNNDNIRNNNNNGANNTNNNINDNNNTTNNNQTQSNTTNNNNIRNSNNNGANNTNNNINNNINNSDANINNSDANINNSDANINNNINNSDANINNNIHNQTQSLQTESNNNTNNATPNNITPNNTTNNADNNKDKCNHCTKSYSARYKKDLIIICGRCNSTIHTGCLRKKKLCPMTDS